MLDGRKRVLIVDDEAGIRDSLSLLLKNNFEVTTAKDGEEALEILDAVDPDLVLLDVLMPRLDGLETLKRMREKNNALPIVMLTATNTVKSAVAAMKYGARDYLNKPFDVEELTSLIISLLDRSGDEDPMNKVVEPGVSRPSIPLKEADFGPLIGRSEVMQEIFQRVRQIAERNTTVLITGESGTGKELIARQIHKLSQRSQKPFVAINCAAIPETLIESELFGHEKGAFTHAVERRIGHFELADGGTLFLDEIGELSLPVQVKMLRFLQEQEFYRVGRSKPLKVDVRIVAATNKSLEEQIKEKKFRQDLFYRVNVISIHLPPLRDRFDDIPAMVQHFIDRFSSVYGNRKIQFSPEAMEILVSYDWPGNVRELENTIESLMALAPDEMISGEMLPRKLSARSASGVEVFKPQVFEGSMDFEEAERAFETDMIVKALRKTNYVQTRAAELLGISRRILKYKMDKLGISDRPEPGRTEAVPGGEDAA
ncbi:MAG: sigma-54-dependent Fis family transcriptional regulator [Deltaproteobacteria bacterium]|nr:sigma-54-dependent Fis family transcriptional regulator [Deltaproteobacteria bacterium]